MKQVLLLLVICSCVVYVYAQPGTLDPSFGEQGKALGGGFGYANDMALTREGKILMLGESNGLVSLYQFSNNGKPDSSFGLNGKKQLPINGGSDGADIAVLADGKFIIAGTSVHYEREDNVFNYDVFLIRFKKSGVIDSVFGTNGIATTDVGNTDLEYNMALQSDGKIVIGGSTNRGALLVRYLENGLPDETFGNGGKRVIEVYPVIRAVAVQEDGKIIAGSTVEDNFFNAKFRLVRYDVNGAIDTTFGKEGAVTTDFGKGGDQLEKLLIQKNGQILAAGNTNASTVSSEMLISRYMQNGMIDSSFGDGGKGIAKFESEIAVVLDFAVQQNGKIVLCGSSYVLDGSQKFVLCRFDANGNTDSTFGINGKMMTDFGNPGPAHAVAIQNDGKIVAGGYSDPFGSTTDVALARYYGDPTHPLLTKIKRWIRNHILNFESTGNGDVGYYVIEKQTSSGAFKDVATITANFANKYQVDLSKAGLATGNNVYRIKGVLKDGCFLYSDIITDVVLATAGSFTIFPNPAKDKINIQSSKAITLRLQNSSGDVLLTQKINGSGSMDISKLRSGVYYLVDVESGVRIGVVKE